jgi:uncharacterized caspase-like protein
MFNQKSVPATQSPLHLPAVGVLILCAASVTFGQESGKPTPAASIDAPQNWALLVGVNAYAEMRPLKYCVFDMKAVRSKLIDAGFPPENVFLLTDTVAELKYKPTRNNVLRQLEMLVQILRPNDRLVVAFSGHGVHMNNASYFCPADANLANPNDTLVPLDKVYEMINSCQAQVKLLMVDACRNDPFRPGDKGVEDAAKAAGLQAFTGEQGALPEGIVLLSSCKRGQQSWEDEDLHHGVFMYFLLKGLEGAADENHDGRIGLLELYHYAEARTRAHVLRSHNAVQVPSLRGEIASDPVIAFVPREISRRVDEAEPVAVVRSIVNSTNPAVKLLLDQGNNFFATGEYDKAVQAYGNAINMEPQNLSLYVKRGAAYRAKGDVKMAVIDYQTANQPLNLHVTEPSAILRDGERISATLSQGQSLSVTKVQHFGESDWLWVASVDGNDAARGWIQMSSVEPKPAVGDSASASAASVRSNSDQQSSLYYRGDDDGDYGGKSGTPVARILEKKLDVLTNRFDRSPGPVLGKQIDLPEHRLDRMDRSRK